MVTIALNSSAVTGTITYPATDGFGTGSLTEISAIDIRFVPNNFVQYNSIQSFQIPYAVINQEQTSGSSLADYNNYVISGIHDATGGLYHAWSNSVTSHLAWNYVPVKPIERIKEIIQARKAPLVVRRTPLVSSAEMNEIRARETLRRVIGEVAYRNYLTKGFISVKGKSGRVYQIFPGNKLTHVFENGRGVESLCIQMTGQFPPTDVLIMRYLLVLNNEDDFCKRANRNSYCPPVPRKLDLRPLPVIMQELRQAA